ncbi:MAG: hypothetical protein V4527_03440 [Pseudomonadota bacterium]
MTMGSTAADFMVAVDSGVAPETMAGFAAADSVVASQTDPGLMVAGFMVASGMVPAADTVAADMAAADTAAVDMDADA